MQTLNVRTEQDGDGANRKVVAFAELRMRVAHEAGNDANCERTDVVNKILAGVNASVAPGRLPATWAQINGNLRGLPLHELYRLHRDCQNARVYGAMFWYLAKRRRAVDKPLAAPDGGGTIAGPDIKR